MATDILVPTLGESVTEATVATWLVKPGDTVAVDQPVVELETEKATLEVGAPTAGVLAEVLVAEGEDVEVGAVLGRIDENATAAAEPAAAKKEAKSEPDESSDAPKPAAEAPPSEPAATPPPASKTGLDPGAIPRSGAGGTVTAADLRSALQLDAPAADLDRSGPAVQKLMAEHGLPADAVTPTGRGGRIIKGDVLRALESRDAPADSPTAAREERVDDVPREERVKMGRLRRTIARRLKEAQETAAILTTFNEIDMSAVIAARKRYRDEFEQAHGVRLGFMSFFAKACVAALKAVPEVNAEIDDEEVVYKNYYHLGMAVSAPQGLVVPVIRDCDAKSFAEIESSLNALAEKARDGKLTQDEMTGGTFTLSNGGVFGSLLSTPILNRPQSGILGLHKIEDRPVAVDGEVAIRPMMYVALSYDHRIVDGKGAVTFLVHVKQAIEDPERLLLGL